jgi:hypothetical protein
LYSKHATSCKIIKQFVAIAREWILNCLKSKSTVDNNRFRPTAQRDKVSPTKSTGCKQTKEE